MLYFEGTLNLELKPTVLIFLNYNNKSKIGYMSLPVIIAMATSPVILLPTLIF